MASAIPVAHSNPRNMPGSGYSSHYAPRTSSDYSHSSSTSTHQTSYWPNHAASSVSTTSSVAPPRINPGLAAAQFVTKHSSKSRLHKRSKSDTVEDDIEEGLFQGDDAFFGKLKSPSKSKSKVAIKPLLQKLPISSRGNSLDLSRSDGGLPGGVGLGIFDTPYDSSGVDDERVETAFPRNPPRRRHTRNTSHTSDGSYGSPALSGAPTPAPGQPFSHPKRQVPRSRGVYTPEMSRDASSNEDSDSNNEEVRETRQVILSGSAQNGDALNELNHSGRSTPMLPTLTTSMSDLHSYTRAARNPSATSRPSPTTPISADSSFPPVSSILSHSASTKSKKSKTRGRIMSSHKAANPIREASPGFVESVTAARLAWERKEEKKAEKLEKKRRQSEAKEEERRTSLSLGRRSFQGHRNRGNSSMSNNTWTDDSNTLASHSSCHLRRGKTGSHNSSPIGSLEEEHTYDEHEEDSSDDEVFYGRETEEWREREKRKQEKAAAKSNKKWSGRGAFGRSSSAASNNNFANREKCSSPNRESTSQPQLQRPTTGISEKSYPPGYGPGAMTLHRKGGIKRHWSRFVVWMRIGMVRLGRKMGF